MSEFEHLLRAHLAPLDFEHLSLIDDSAKHAGHPGARSGGGHYRLQICAAAFNGKNTMARHRLVYQHLGQLMQTHIHAISITALTPEETAPNV